MTHRHYCSNNTAAHRLVLFAALLGLGCAGSDHNATFPPLGDTHTPAGTQRGDEAPLGSGDDAAAVDAGAEPDAAQIADPGWPSVDHGDSGPAPDEACSAAGEACLPPDASSPLEDADAGAPEACARATVLRRSFDDKPQRFSIKLLVESHCHEGEDSLEEGDEHRHEVECRHVTKGVELNSRVHVIHADQGLVIRSADLFIDYSDPPNEPPREAIRNEQRAAILELAKIISSQGGYLRLHAYTEDGAPTVSEPLSDWTRDHSVIDKAMRAAPLARPRRRDVDAAVREIAALPIAPTAPPCAEHLRYMVVVLTGLDTTSPVPSTGLEAVARDASTDASAPKLLIAAPDGEISDYKFNAGLIQAYLAGGSPDDPNLEAEGFASTFGEGELASTLVEGWTQVDARNRQRLTITGCAAFPAGEVETVELFCRIFGPALPSEIVVRASYKPTGDNTVCEDADPCVGRRGLQGIEACREGFFCCDNDQRYMADGTCGPARIVAGAPCLLDQAPVECVESRLMQCGPRGWTSVASCDQWGEGYGCAWRADGTPYCAPLSGGVAPEEGDGDGGSDLPPHDDRPTGCDPGLMICVDSFMLQCDGGGWVRIFDCASIGAICSEEDGIPACRPGEDAREEPPGDEQ